MSNQIKSLLLSHHHNTCALVSEILESVLQTVQKQFTYRQYTLTDLSRKQCAEYAYIYSVHTVYYLRHTYNYQYTLCTICTHFVRALPWQPCLCCLGLMFRWLSCVLTHCFVFVCVYHVFLWSHLLVSLGHAPLFSPCLILVSLTVLTWPSCAFLPLYCAVFLLCLWVRLVP